MFATLPASTPAEGPGSAITALSSLVHALLIGGAIVITGTVARPPDAARTVSPLPIYVAPTMRHELAAIISRSAASPAPGLPAFRIAIPREVPIGIPPVRVAEQGPPILDDRPGPGGTSHLIGDPAPGPAAHETYLATEVDEPIEIVREDSPAYPATLRLAGITDVVEVQYVVDTLGRIEPHSIENVGKARDAFVEAVRVSLLSARFRPARVHGRAVRQLVRQRFRFDLDH